MADPILDADITNEKTAYRLLVTDGQATRDAAALWYQTDTGRVAALTDIWHLVDVRMGMERLRWRTPRRAWSEEYPHGGGPVPAPVFDPAGKLSVAGQFFRSNDQPFTIIESSDFSLMKRVFENDPLAERVLEERATIGFNMTRAWALNQSVVGYRNVDYKIHGVGTPAAQALADDGIHPNQYPDFYERMRRFCELCKTYGQHVDLTVFTQALTLMPNRDDQQRHIDQTADAVRDFSHVILSLVNENDVADNQMLHDLSMPSGVLITRGSNGSEQTPPRHDAPLSAEEFHTNDANEFQRKVGHNAMEWADESRKPCWANENTRYPDRDSSVIHAEDAAENGALLCAGSCFHSWAGKRSVLFDDVERACAEAWVRGARLVPLEFQAGRYEHHTELETPGVIRVHSRRLNDGRRYDGYVRE